jgi:hypothetical protein
VRLWREELSDARHGMDSRGAEVSGSMAAGPAFRASGRLGLRRVDPAAPPATDGEVTLTWLPADQRRVDLSATRIVVADHVSAVLAGLDGWQAGVGTDQAITRRSSLGLGVDVTAWSTGNYRLRLRATPRLRLDGIPMATVEWPTLVQRYSAPFDFGYFDPPTYLETGPALHLYRRFDRVWHLSGYVRGGIHRETGEAFRPLGTVLGSLERETNGGWSTGATLSWTNSNLAGAAGFQRTRLATFAQRRL